MQTTRQANQLAKLIFDMQDKMFKVMCHKGGSKKFDYLSRRVDSFLMNEGVSECLLELKGVANSKRYLEWLQDYEA